MAFNATEFEYSDINSYKTPSNSFVAQIPAGIKDADNLLRTLSEKLKLPTYFGFNWNALDECLRDFHWIIEQEIVILHEDLPSLNGSDLNIYLSVLSSAIKDWAEDMKGNHKLKVIFPKTFQVEIERLETID